MAETKLRANHLQYSRLIIVTSRTSQMSPFFSTI
eukprot:COSAG06_NODE_58487_length_277_cov_0.550562_1_plen_33_part_10